ncbi:MAG: RnfABCDGE type electron transport complex subunit G [Candidatus Omnitrophica bacterium]|nr:RnfABCDGE type electron transport complex subunit G [Candidatus Omnitrophota bacterium]
MKEYAKFSLTLFVICLVSAAFLSIVYSVTEPAIRKQAQAAEVSSLRKVVPEAADYKQEALGQNKLFTVFDADKKCIGYAFLCEAQGYSGAIKIMVGIDAAGDIKGVDIVEHSETPGLGSRIQEQGFLSGFKGRSYNDIQGVDTIGGATISSAAVIKAVEESLKEVIKSIK